MYTNKQFPLPMGTNEPPDGVHEGEISGILTRSRGLGAGFLEQVIVRCAFENYRDDRGQALEHERSFKVPSVAYDSLLRGLECREMTPEEVAQTDPHKYEGQKIKLLLKQPKEEESHYRSPIEQIFGFPQPRTGYGPRDASKTLHSLMNKRRRFQATFNRNGLRKNYNGYLEQTFCFQDIRLQVTGEQVLNHVWFKDLVCLRQLGVLAAGDQIEFDARVGLVKKGYRGSKRWERQSNPPREEISLLNPTRMTRLSGSQKDTFEYN